MKLDPKSIFYLKHRQQIEEWIALQEKVAEEADSFFRSLASALSTLAASLPGAVTTYVDLDHTRPKLFLCHPAWFDNQVGCPRVAIGMEWKAKKTRFDQSWAGVWINTALDADDRLHKALIAEFQQGPSLTSGFSSEKGWPVWRYEPPAEPEFWNDLDTFARQLLQTVRERWTNFSPYVERAVKAAP